MLKHSTDPQNGPFRETFRSFVNTWECDENQHMNVQFYFRAFQQASEILAAQTTGSNPGSRTAIVRHVRYHRELHVARLFHIESALLAEGAHAGAIVHRLIDTETGTLAATALDQPGYRTDGIPICGVDAVEAAMPRGIDPGPTLPADTTTLIGEGKALVVHRSIVRNEETGPDGDLISNAIISRFTDGVPHAWSFNNISSDWLSRTGHGRVAVELKLTRLKQIEAGTALNLISWFAAVEEKTFLICHQLEEMATGEPVAAGQVRALIMNLNTRRAVPVPDFARAHAV